MGFLIGLVGGVVVYCATALPFAAVTGVDGDVWQGIFLLYGVICGAIGVMMATAHDLT